ncbi:MAG TPA: hypothetical protein PKE58_11940, partial [Acidobacteriota bacterium]|nr:hypothetical protein [Acidobacteriota bacterium]
MDERAGSPVVGGGVGSTFVEGPSISSKVYRFLVSNWTGVCAGGMFVADLEGAALDATAAEITNPTTTRQISTFGFCKMFFTRLAG